MKNRLISFFLCFAVLTTVIALPAAAEEATYDKAELNNAAALLEAVGILDAPKNDNQYVEKLSRAEFAQYLTYVFNVDVYEAQTDRYYYDVPHDHWAIKSINYLYERGVLTMNSSRSFQPDELITKDEAYKMAVEALGYGDYAVNNGGYPVGYRNMANRLGITDNVSNQEAVNFADTTFILANLIKTTVMEGTAYSEDSVVYTDSKKNTLLSVYHNIYIEKGRITAVPGISLNDIGVIEDGKAALEKQVYDCSVADIRHYLGYTVYAYVKKNDRNSARGEILFVEEDKETEKVVIDAADYQKFDPATYIMQYWEKDSLRSVNVSKGVSVVKNGDRANDDIANVFSINKGRIELIDTNGDGIYEYAVIWEYKNVLVGNIDTDKQLIYNKLENTDKIPYGEAVVDTVYVFDKDGKAASMMDVMPGSLLTVYQAGGYLEIHICDSAVSQKVFSLRKEGDKLLVSLGTEEASAHTALVDKDYQKKHENEIVAGMIGLVYYDYFGNIAYIDRSNGDDINFGFLINYKEIGDFNPVMNLLILTEANSVEVFPCAKRVNVDGGIKKTSQEILAGLEQGKPGAIGQVIVYEVNGNNEITRVDTVAKGSDTGKTLELSCPMQEKVYSTGTKNFGSDILVSNDTVCFVVPNAADITKLPYEEFQALPPVLFMAEQSYMVESYKMDLTGGYEDALLCRMDIEVARTVDNFFVIEEIYNALSEDGETIEMVDGYVNGIKFTYEVRDGVSLLAQGYDTGDIVYPVLDAKGAVSKVTAVYDYSSDKVSTLWTGTGGNQYGNFNTKLYVARGNVLSTKDDVLKIGIGDNLSKVDIASPCANTPMTVCEVKKGKLTFSSGKIQDVIGYDVSATDYSKVFIKTNYAVVKDIVIYK